MLTSVLEHIEKASRSSVQIALSLRSIYSAISHQHPHIQVPERTRAKKTGPTRLGFTASFGRDLSRIYKAQCVQAPRREVAKFSP